MTASVECQSLGPAPASQAPQAGRYVYCIAPAGEGASLGAIGIEGCLVYTVVHGGLRAVVHDCAPEPYRSSYPEVVARWVLAHHQVVDAAWRRWGLVLPLTFNTIVSPSERSAQENLVAWLEAERNSLESRLEALVGKSEYGVQLFWDAAVIAQKVAEASPEIQELHAEIATKHRGVAYMYRQRMERLLRQAMEARAAQEFQALHARISRWADRIRVDRNRNDAEGRQMLMNLSCLVSLGKLPEFRGELERISKEEGLDLRVVGPLPPYSFC